MRVTNIQIVQAFLGNASDADLRQMVADWLSQFPDAESALRQLPNCKSAVVSAGAASGQELGSRFTKVTRGIANDYGTLWTCDRPPGRPVEAPSGQRRESTTIRLDPDLKQRAQTAGLKLGPLLEEAIQRKLGE